jgi:hypothetical protein
MIDDRLIYKMLMRSCVFNDIKHDKKVLLCVTVLDFCKFARLSSVLGHANATLVLMLMST